MSAILKFKQSLILAACLIPFIAIAANKPAPPNHIDPSLTKEALEQQLGWIMSNDPHYLCGGYYVEQPFNYLGDVTNSNAIEITSDQTLFSQHGTSTLTGKVTVTRLGQQITSNIAYLYRDSATSKLSTMDMIGNVHLREPNTLVVGKKGRYDFTTKAKSLIDIFYRTVMGDRVAPKLTPNQKQTPRILPELTAWGEAHEFSQTESGIYELERASFSTCPPIHPTWRVKASHIVLNKNTGRGHATHARILVKEVPVFYIPYFNFSIDKKRKSGFLWPTLGASNQWGPYLQTPFYWNMAPNYDMTLTPGFLAKSGFQFIDKFRYLTSTSTGALSLNVIPSDQNFAAFQRDEPGKILAANPNPSAATQAELTRLSNDSLTRKSFLWQDNSHYNDHWSSHVDFSYAGDDYFMRNFGNLNELTQDQLLQQAEINYKGTNWDFTGRIQAYQTLHPVDEVNVDNQYRRFPQLSLNGDFPDQPFGLEYFINNEITHFTILNSPGLSSNQPQPVGNRLHTQPGVSLPLSLPWFYVNPRLQLALTDYNLIDNTPNNSEHRALPIFDVATGLFFNRDLSFFGYQFQQTFEPQLYYTYIPYRDQSSIPVFDTTTNTLTYDQLFNYNRFTGIDRIGDANQMGVGISSRFIDQASGLEKVRVGVGEIIYFANRLVTLCDSATLCGDYPGNHSNYQRLSPVSGLLSYSVSPYWNVTGNSIWDPVTKQIANTTLSLHYQPTTDRIINLGYGYARGGDVASGVPGNDPSNNLKVSDFSFAWPAFHAVSIVGRWSQNWNHGHLQNLLYGLQYDTCCWAVRMVGGRAFTTLDATNNNKPQYNSELYIQFSLKGLGDIGSGSASGLLSTITGYQTSFGQEH